MKMTGSARTSITLAFLATALMTAACSKAPVGRAASGRSVVPAPLRLEPRAGAFSLGPSTRIVVPEDRPGAVPVATMLKDLLDRPTGYDLAVETVAGPATGAAVPAGTIVLRLEDLEERLGREGYLLEVGTEGILLQAADPAGLFYGVQTLRQLLPAAIEGAGGAAREPAWTVPCVSVEDRPRFAWRGALLDCARHFFPKEFVLRWIDILAMHKLNTFHWHLTDDQGWRIEIKKYPRLTEVGRLAASTGRTGTGTPASPSGRARPRPTAASTPRTRSARSSRTPPPGTSRSSPRSRCPDTPRPPSPPTPSSRAPAGLSPSRRAAIGPSPTSSAPERKAPSSSWRTCWPRSSSSFPAPTSTSAATRSTRPNGGAAPIAWPG